MAVDRINPGAMLAREIKKSKLSFKTLGERLERVPTSVQLMLVKDNMSVERLLACSKALNYNFFLEIGYKIHCPGPSDPKRVSLTATVAELQAELQKVISDAAIEKRILETELNTLKQVMKEFFTAKQV